jgi:Na+-translocating ferredoxin:NAD+ oxidoreductase RnfC subunit
MRDGRRVPVKTLAKRLHVLEYDLPAPWIGEIPDPDMVTLPLKQSAGVPVKPLVKVNDNVVKGQKIGEPPENALGAILHSSIDGKVVLVDDSKIVIEKS